MYDSDDCPIKTENTFTKEEIERIKYNGAKESPLHIELKEFIKNSLIKNKENDKGISHVESERIYKDKAISKEWRKPDVSSVYKGLRLVLELQLSTTFLSTIVARENFYKERKIYILWIFHQFDTDSDLQKFTQKDVIYANKQNAFVLNKEAQAKSIESNDLVLLCYYQEPYLDNQNISTRWKSKYVSLNDLKFDEKEYKVFFYDTEQEVTNLKLRVQYEREEKVKLAQERHDKIESRVKQVLLLFNEFFKTDRCPQKLNYELPRLSHEEAECLYAKILNTRYGNISKPFIHYLIEHGKHNNLLLFLFQQKYINEKIGYQFPDLCWKVFTSNLNQAEREAMEKVKSFLFAIISLKLGIIINSKLPNFNAYSNHILHSKREFSKLFIKSLRRYDRYKTILANDKSGAFRKKIAEIENSSLPQNESYDHIFIKIFPELFDQTQ